MKRQILAGLVLAALAGCASPGKDAAKNPDTKEVEYVYYTPTGSNIPVRVRKDQLQSAAADSAHDQKALRNVQQRTNRTDPKAAGN